MKYVSIILPMGDWELGVSRFAWRGSSFIRCHSADQKKKGWHICEQQLLLSDVENCQQKCFQHHTSNLNTYKDNCVWWYVFISCHIFQLLPLTSLGHYTHSSTQYVFMEHLLYALHWASDCRAQTWVQKLNKNSRIKQHETNQEMLQGRMWLNVQ